MKTLTIKEYADIFGVTTDTVRKWELRGKIKPYRTGGGHRRYTEDDVKAIDANVKAKRKVTEAVQRNIIYCRISDEECQEELAKQVESLKIFALGRSVKAEVIVEIGDGTYMARQKFVVKALIQEKQGLLH